MLSFPWVRQVDLKPSYVAKDDFFIFMVYFIEVMKNLEKYFLLASQLHLSFPTTKRASECLGILWR